MHRIVFQIVTLGLSPLALSSCDQAPDLTGVIDLNDVEMVDLTHTLDGDTVFWPTSPILFEHEELAYGMTDGGYFNSAYTLHLPEHGGTHLDAPIHFSRQGVTVDQIPLEDLLGPCVVIDVTAKAKLDSNYQFTIEDISDFEAAQGKIEPGSIVLLKTGWNRYWPDAKTYLGDDTAGDASRLSFPGFGADATAFLLDERDVKAIGVDTASIDSGQSKDFRVHQIVAERNIPAFENLTNLERLPNKGAFLIALPMKIGGGSGGPLRVMALLSKDES